MRSFTIKLSRTAFLLLGTSLGATGLCGFLNGDTEQFWLGAVGVVVLAVLFVHCFRKIWSLK